MGKHEKAPKGLSPEEQEMQEALNASQSPEFDVSSQTGEATDVVVDSAPELTQAAQIDAAWQAHDAQEEKILSYDEAAARVFEAGPVQQVSAYTEAGYAAQDTSKVTDVSFAAPSTRE